MSNKGLIIGAVVGAVLMTPLVGAVVGGAVGHFFIDRPRNLRERKSEKARNTFTGAGGTSDEAHNTIIESTFSLMGYVCRGAGRINEDQISRAEDIMDVMALSAEKKQTAIGAFNRGKSSGFSPAADLFALKQLAVNNETVLTYFMEILVSIAIADDELSESEHQRLLEIGNQLGFSAEAIERQIRLRMAEQQIARFAENMRRRAERQGDFGWGGQDQSAGADGGSGGGSGARRQRSRAGSGYESSGAPKNELANAYELLGVTPGTPWSDVRRAHKKLMLKYHPDRLASQGLPPEMVRLYTKKAQDIQAAFEIIRRDRGESR